MIKKPCVVGGFLLITWFLLPCILHAQKQASISWLSFEQLEDSLQVNKHAEQPKKVFIDFYTDWCTYCRKMDRVVFTKPEVIDLLNEHYYAVRFNAESESAISFGGRTFVNDQFGKVRSPIHQITQFLASREGQFVPPTLLVLDEEFKVIARYFEYMDSSRLKRALAP